MKKLATILLLSTLISPAIAQSELNELDELAFSSTDMNADGFLSMSELQEQGVNIFISMDADEDNNLTQEEFMSWGFGKQVVAEEIGRKQAYETALRITFDLWDRNKNGLVSSLEHRQGISIDVFRSDLDLDGRLSKDEFFGSFVINVALNAALKSN
ncbi:MAG: hypothetical protein L3J15_01770 [Devosiaceae bacterium]|nr:hypothetical protein [Devosiaceae bacterium]